MGFFSEPLVSCAPLSEGPPRTALFVPSEGTGALAALVDASTHPPMGSGGAALRPVFAAAAWGLPVAETGVDWDQMLGFLRSATGLMPPAASVLAAGFPSAAEAD